MSTKIENLFKRVVSKDAKEYKKLNSTGSDKGNALNILTKEIAIVRDEQNNLLDSEIKNARLDLDTKKFDQQTKLEEEKLKLEADKNIAQQLAETRKLDLEERKLDLEEKTKRDEINREKREKFLTIALDLVKILVPLAINTALVVMNFRLIYADDGRTPSEMRDLMKVIYHNN